MGWLVTERRLNEYTDWVFHSFKKVDEDLRRLREDIEEQQKKLFRRFRDRIQAQLTLVTERSEQATRRLLDLEARLASLEATHHKVGYVPVDAFKALSDGDIDKMADVSQQVRDQLKEIVALQERMDAAMDPNSGPVDL